MSISNVQFPLSIFESNKYILLLFLLTCQNLTLCIIHITYFNYYYFYLNINTNGTQSVSKKNKYQICVLILPLSLFIGVVYKKVLSLNKRSYTNF